MSSAGILEISGRVRSGAISSVRILVPSSLQFNRYDLDMMDLRHCSYGKQCLFFNMLGCLKQWVHTIFRFISLWRDLLIKNIISE